MKNSLDAKYGMNKSKESEKNSKQESETILRSWKDSYDVSELSFWLKKYSTHGITLCQRSGIPFLKYSPGLSLRKDNPERYDCAEFIEELFSFAFNDLKFLIQNNLLSLKEVNHV